MKNPLRRAAGDGPPDGAGPGGQRLSNHARFRNEELDLYFQAFALGYAAYGGSSAGEAFHAAARIDERDLDSWIREWTAVAERADAQARAAAERGHDATARQAWLRAFTYYRTANACIRPSDPRFMEGYGHMRRTFGEAAARMRPPAQRLDVPYAGATLPGYFIKPDGDERPRRTFIVIGGGDTYVEDLWFWGGAGAVERGWNVLLVDLPGQGATADQGLHYQHDVEVPFAAVLDALLARPDVDPGRVGVLGLSLGGYIAMRVAAHEPRVAAIAASTPIVDWRGLLFDAMPPAVRIAPKVLDAGMALLGRFFNPAQRVAYEKFFEWQVGASSTYQALESFRPWTVDVSRISCPVLALVGQSEGEAFKTQAERAYAELTGPKAIVRFDEGSGADAHCQANHLRLQHETALDWMGDLFDAR